MTRHRPRLDAVLIALAGCWIGILWALAEALSAIATLF